MSDIVAELKSIQERAKKLVGNRDQVLRDIGIEERLQQVYERLKDLGIENIEDLGKDELEELINTTKDQVEKELKLLTGVLEEGEKLFQKYAEAKS